MTNNEILNILVATPLYPPEIGGPATYCRFLETYLPKETHRLRIIRFFEVRHLPYIVRHFVFFWKIFRAAKDADIIYALDPLGVGIPAAFAAKLRGKRFFLRVAGDRAWETAVQKWGITESLDAFSSSSKYSQAIKVLKNGQKKCANMAEKIIVPSRYLRGIVENWGIQKPEKITLIYNAFTPPPPSLNKEDLRKKFGLSGLVLMSAGRLVPWKGFETIIRLIPEIKKVRPGVSLFIAGDGPLKETLEAVVREMSLETSVQFLGRVSQDELLERIKAADVFILNTFYEGFSHQLLEAMSQGTVILSTNVGGNPELIEDKKYGYLVPYNSQEMFLSVLCDIAKNGPPPEIAEGAKEKLLDFAPEKIIAAFIKEFQ